MLNVSTFGSTAGIYAIVHLVPQAWVGVLRQPPTTFPLHSFLTQSVYRQGTRNSHREWQYHMLHVYNCILLKMSTWGSKHIEAN